MSDSSQGWNSMEAPCVEPLSRYVRQMINGRPSGCPSGETEDAMTYVVVSSRETIVSKPFTCYASAFSEATRLFGDDAASWLKHNVRVEEDRPTGQTRH
jgi:hypothetical protein